MNVVIVIPVPISGFIIPLARFGIRFKRHSGSRLGFNNEVTKKVNTDKKDKKMLTPE